MDDSCSVAPIWFTDVIGSALMIIFSFLSVWYATRLRRTDPSNVVWTYLLWLCWALAAFGLSRGVGHIAKRVLLMLDMRDVWVSLRPYSGAFNTLWFAVVASTTLFFQHVQKIHTAILNDRNALEEATSKVMHLNRNLESLVQERTGQLGRSEKKYRRIFEGSMDMIFILDRESRFVDMNPAGLATVGYDREDLIGRRGLDALFVEPNGYQSFIRDLHSNGYVRDRECIFGNKDRGELHMLVSATIRKDDAGTVANYEGIAKDITARVNMERQLQRADRLASLGQISTGLAHEINNPLGIMLGYTQLLLREQPADSQLFDDLKTIEKHVRHCKTIVEDLLKFARSTQTNTAFVNVNECLDEVVSLLAHQFELDSISLVRELDPSIPLIVADGEKLKQVFMNLLVNARQAISGKGAVVVRTVQGRSPHEVTVEIEDTGEGIPPELVEKIFDPFFTTKPVGEGTGLGLSVSYGIVQDHNGHIEVSSRPGHGTTFFVSLPVPEGAKNQGERTAQ